MWWPKCGALPIATNRPWRYPGPDGYRCAAALFGRSAKAMELMPVQDKRYTASIRFGVTTDTQDCTGNILSTSESR